MKTELTNAPEAVKKQLELKDAELYISQTVSRHVESVEGNLAKVVFKVKPEKAEMKISGTVIPIPKNDSSIGERTISVDMSPSGRIDNDNLPGTESEDDGVLSADSVRLIYRQISLPQDSVRPGAQWKEEVDAPMSVGYMKVKMKGAITYTFKKLEKFKGKSCALITFTGDFKTGLEPGVGAPPLEGICTSSGSVWFDYSAGEVAASDNTMDFNLEMKLKGFIGEAAKATGMSIKTKAIIKTEMNKISVAAN